MLSLPRVTLCCIDCANHDLALAALEQCVRKCSFARVLFITDRDYAIDGIDCVRIPTIDSRAAYSQFVMKELHAHIVTDDVEDVAICRTYRPYLEKQHGIRFAPEAVADRFAFEASYWTSPPFGFHGLYNFWMFLDRAGLGAFLSMATPRILGSIQCLRLAKNYIDLKRNEEASMVLRR